MSKEVKSLWSAALEATKFAAVAGVRSAVAAGAEKAGSAADGVLNLVGDPSVLAKIVIAATATQEQVNQALLDLGSVYRIGDVQITLGLPPNVAFTIARTGDPSALDSVTIATKHEEALESPPPPPPPPPLPNR